MLTRDERERLEETALAVRRHVIRLAGRGGCFLGASLSCVDLVVYLYGRWLRGEPASDEDPDRDVVLLSKGHDVPALYGTFAELGIIDPSRLDSHLSTDDVIYWHPNTAVPGIEFHSGSLGHLPAVGLGIALDRALRGSAGRTVVIVGDGELNEGSVWEAIQVAAAYRAPLTMIVDRNGFQANLPTEALIPLEPLEAKFAAFGWQVARVDGHDFEALDACLGAVDCTAPGVVIADTVRGKGLPSMERRADRWFVRLDEGEVDQVLAELDSGRPAHLTSPTLVVR